MTKYFKCEHWYGHFPCYSVLNDPEPYLKDDESKELLIGVLHGKKKDMEGLLILFPIQLKEIEEFDKLKDKAKKYINEFSMRPGSYTKIRKVNREHHWCPEREVILFRKKKRKSRSKSEPVKKEKD